MLEYDIVELWVELSPHLGPLVSVDVANALPRLDLPIGDGSQGGVRLDPTNSDLGVTSRIAQAMVIHRRPNLLPQMGIAVGPLNSTRTPSQKPIPDIFTVGMEVNGDSAMGERH
jgi:hypothetical protein